MSSPLVTLRWNQGTIGDWQRLLAAVPRLTLTQSFAYAQAVNLCERFLPRLGIIEVDGRTVGFVQVLERTVMGLIHITRIQRGPLWLEDPPDPAVVAETLRLLRAEYPAGLTRWTSFLPELPAGDDSVQTMKAAGFRRLKGEGYRTIWLDLRPPVDALRRRLAGNWRNHLKLAEQSGLRIEIDPEAKALPWLVERHLADKKKRGYRGPSGPLVIRLRNALWKDGNVLLLRAHDEEGPVAGILVLRHGQAATWLIGWSGADGRRLGAHTLLLWQAALKLKSLGVVWFDLGGINPGAAAGVTAFKRGLRGAETELAGSFV